MLYVEGASGISGDMTVGALLSLGASRERLDAALASLRLEDEFSYVISEKSSYGISGIDFDVQLRQRRGNRNLADVRAIIDRAALTSRARAFALRAFGFVADAEARVHGLPVEQVHFHEAGATDSIVDIVSAAVLFDDLGETDCVVTGLTEGTGTVRCARGELPVPVPAVLNIAAATGIPLRPCGIRCELVTPTGIALAATMRTTDQLPEAFRVQAIGTGLGKRDYGRPAILRILRGTASAEKSEGERR